MKVLGGVEGGLSCIGGLVESVKKRRKEERRKEQRGRE